MVGVEDRKRKYVDASNSICETYHHGIMELRHLRYFLAVAEELNFTRAAKRLNIAQPPLTQQIKALENELGVLLFDRSYRIALTDAGKVLQTEATRIISDVRSAVILVKQAARGAGGRVRVGFTESASFNPVVTSAIRRYRVRFPEIEISLEERQTVGLAEALHDGRIDVAFIRPPLAGGRGLAVTLLEKEDMVIAVPRAHPLATRKTIKLGELRDETFILYPRSVRPGLADTVIAECERSGFVPRVSQYAPQLSSTINLVAASLGISIVPQSMRGMQRDSVRYINITNRPLQAELAVALREDESAPGVLNFVRSVLRSANVAPQGPKAGA